ncbi:MAG: DUF3568 family protein [Verrucomicrobiales bacterium]|nr:DUF3568 family protein [Verrucomicrobiales bacterium]
MNHLKVWGRLTVLLAAMSCVQGCAVLLVGGAAAGVAYGTIKYSNNTLETTHNVSLDRVWTAATAALKDLQLPVNSSKKDGSAGVLQSKNAQGQPVTVQAIRKTDTVTDVRITVGTFDSAENRTKAQQIHDKLKARL